MYEYYPLLVIGAILGVISTVIIIAYSTIRGQKEAIGFDRNMKDKEILKQFVKDFHTYSFRFHTMFNIQIYNFYLQYPNRLIKRRKKRVICVTICKLFVYLSPEGVFFIK